MSTLCGGFHDCFTPRVVAEFSQVIDVARVQ